MAKVTSKFQVTLPKAIVERYGIRVGDEIRFEPAGPVIRVAPPRTRPRLTAAQRLEIFDQASERQVQREQERRQHPAAAAGDRGWTRDQLYDRPGRWPRS
jgi:AbrB family looped-hinge helix DNA binding protein